MAYRARGLGAALAAGMLVALGAALMLWPTATRALNADALRTRAVMAQSALAPVVREGAENAPLVAARAMNEELAARPAPWFGPEAAPTGYGEWAPLDDEVVASIEIPSLDLALPVRRGTTEEVLAAGAGHLPGSSLPVGGASTNCVLAGHTAFRGARLFDDIGSLQPGELVVLHTCAGALGYRVVEAAIIEPTDAQALAIQPGRDLLTLLTCYPPRVNTQRLIVVCERDEGAAVARESLGGASADRHEGTSLAGPTGVELDGPPDAAQATGATTGARESGHMPGWVVAGLCLVVCLASGTLVPLILLALQGRRDLASRWMTSREGATSRAVG